MKFYAIVMPFVEVSLLKRAPQDLPANTLLLALVMLAYAIVGVFSLQLRYGFADSLILMTLELVMMAGIVSVMLTVAGVAARIPQTLTAFAGASTFITVVTLPLQNWVANAQAAKTIGNDHRLMMLLVVFWSLAVTAHVLRHALSSAMFVGVLLSLLYMWLSLELVGGALALIGAT